MNAPLDLSRVPGWEGTQGPGPGQYGDPHVYARDVTSGSGNCACGREDTHRLHVPVPSSPRGTYPLTVEAPDADTPLVVNLIPKALWALDTLVRIDVPRRVDAVNRALIIAAWITERRAEGYALAVIAPDGETVRVVQGSDASGVAW